jgi:hypothetical protein
MDSRRAERWEGATHAVRETCRLKEGQDRWPFPKGRTAKAASKRAARPAGRKIARKSGSKKRR